MYEVIFDPKAIDFLSKAPKSLKERIYDKVASTKENPHRSLTTGEKYTKDSKRQKSISLTSACP